MKHFRALVFIAALLPGVAAAQTYPTVPDHTVIGRIGTGTGSGPSQAIPFAQLPFVPAGIQSANVVLAGPASGGSASPTFRALVGADLPVPSATTLGGTQSKTCSTSNWFNTISTSGVPGCTQPAFSDLTGSIAATQIPNPSATTLGGVKSLAAITHQYLTSISTTGQPTQAQPSCGDLSDATSCNAARGQLPGTTTNDNASAGNVGEEIESVIVSGSAVSLSSTIPKDVTTISLTAGDWDVTGSISFLLSASTSVTQMAASNSGTANTLDTTPGKFSQIFMAAVVPGANTFTLPLMSYRLSLASTTTIHLVSQLSFTVSTAAAYGIIRARRMR